MPDITDRTKKVREGEELDLAAVEKFLTDNVPGLSGKLEIEQFPSGHSNLTYLARMGERDMVLRRPPFGSKVKTAHDMGREYKVLSALHPVYSCAPRPLAFCEDESIIGSRFYVMERIKGVILRKELPKGLDFTPEIAGRLSESFIKNLAVMHAIDYEAAGLGDLGKPEGYLNRQVEGWAKRYAGSQTDEIKEIDDTVDWLRERLPASPAPTLVHNDYKYDNIILDANDVTRIIGVLDWEMSTIGDPLTDLGAALGYWVQDDDPPMHKMNAFGPTYAKGSYTRRQLADRYAELTGRDVSNVHYYVVFASFKLLVIIQQIYYRYHQGLTQDERFAGLVNLVKLLAQTGVELIERNEI